MRIDITGRIGEAVFGQIEAAEKKSIEIDVSKIQFFTSKELSRLLIISKKKEKTSALCIRTITSRKPAPFSASSSFFPAGIEPERSGRDRNRKRSRYREFVHPNL